MKETAVPPDAIDVLMEKLLRGSGYRDVLSAALKGDTDAQCYFGMLWEKGIGDMPELTTLEQAQRWYSIVAEAAYDGLRQDAIRHRDRVSEALKILTF